MQFDLMFRYIAQKKKKDNNPTLLNIMYVWHKKVTFLFAFHSHPDQCE